MVLKMRMRDCGWACFDGEGFEVVQRGGALGEAQYLGDRFDRVQTMDLVVRKLQYGHLREGMYGGAIALEEDARGVAAEARLRARLAPGKEETGGEALDVPLEWAADGLVEVVDVEDEAAIGRGEGAEVADVGVAAELGVDAGVGAEREIAGHDGHRSAKESEG